MRSMNTYKAPQAIKAAGGFKAVAQEFGITWQAVQKWSQKQVPAERVPKLARLSGFAVEELRPDVFKDL